MPELERYQILVIGSGEAGKHLAWTMAQAGHRTAVVERKYVGGACPNIACLPSKNEIRSAKAHWFGIWDQDRTCIHGHEGSARSQAKDG
jgi:pyruvate/2-oxoglutarate dehydrogenase complex dihydrolipoamide dehydrogenase (E3) component